MVQIKSNFLIAFLAAIVAISIYLFEPNYEDYYAFVLVAYILTFEIKYSYILLLFFILYFIFFKKIETAYIMIYLFLSIGLNFLSTRKYNKEIDIIFGNRFISRFFVEEKKFSELDLIFTIISFVLLFIL